MYRLICCNVLKLVNFIWARNEVVLYGNFWLFFWNIVTSFDINSYTVLQIGFFSKLNLWACSFFTNIFLYQGLHRGVFICRKNWIILKYRMKPKSFCSKFQVFSRKMLHCFSGCFQLCNILFCSKTHTTTHAAQYVEWCPEAAALRPWQNSFTFVMWFALRAMICIMPLVLITPRSTTASHFYLQCVM